MNELEQAALAQLRAKLMQDCNNLQDRMAEGACMDFASYREMCGKIKGLFIAVEYIDALEKHMKETQ